MSPARRFTIRRSAVALAALLGATPVFAQQQPTAAPAPQAAGPAISLSMDQAVTMALETNLGLKADKLEIVIADQNIVGARSAFLPVVTSRMGRSTSKSVPSDFTQGSTDISSQGMSASGTWTQALRWYGSDYSVSWSGNRNSQTGGISSFNPRLNSSLTVSFTQPLWRDFRTDSGRVGLETSQRRRSIADVQLQQRVVGLESSVKLSYLNLIAAIERRKVAQQNMDISQQSLDNARARVAVGQSPQIDIIQAQAQVRGFEEQLIVADAAISRAEDNLRSLVLDPDRPDYWAVRLQPTDAIQLTPMTVDLDGAIKNALANRLDLAVLRQNMEITDITMRLNENQTKPAVDVGVTYSAQGTGGTQFEFGEGFPPPIVNRTEKSFASVLGDTFGGAYPSWTVGVAFSYPIGRSAAEASLANVQVQKRQQELDRRQLELEIVRQVRDAARQIQNSFQRVQATRAAREASEQQLDAEERRFAVGLSTNLDLQVRQRDLAGARVNELQAMIDYNTALIVFERVQKTQ